MAEHFIAPQRLWLLVIVAGLVATAVWAARRRRRDRVRFSNIELFDQLVPHRPGWRRWVPATLTLAALTSMVVAIAQPVATVQVAVEEATVVLALDTSLSMGATDIEPDRLRAAQDAALAFVDELPDGVQVAVVGFAGTATVLSTPTDERADTTAAIEGLNLAESTAIGDAIDTSVELLEARDLDGDTSAIVVLSDGGTTAGVPSAEAAARAADAGFAVSTIAYGTPDGVIDVDEDGDGTLESVPVPVNDAELAAIAEATGGQALTADSAEEIAAVFDELGSQIGTEPEQREVGHRFTVAAFMFAVAAAATSLWWLGRLA